MRAVVPERHREIYNPCPVGRQPRVTRSSSSAGETAAVSGGGGTNFRQEDSGRDGLNQAVRRQIQQGLRSAGLDPGGADGLFGTRTRAGIRNWQAARGARTTGYLDGPQVEALRGGAQPSASEGATAALSDGVEVVFWQSIVNSTNAADFAAYLEQFPTGVFRSLAQSRLVALRSSAGGAPAAAGPRVGGVGSPPSRARVSASASGTAATSDVRRPSAVIFRPDQTCAGQAAGSACWMETAQQPGCHLWNPGLALGATVAWTGNCEGGFAQGTGTMTWLWDGNRLTETGRLVDGQRTGHWIRRLPDGIVAEAEPGTARGPVAGSSGMQTETSFVRNGGRMVGGHDSRFAGCMSCRWLGARNGNAHVGLGDCREG